MQGDDSMASPRLVVVLYDFEQFESAIVQDMFYICRSCSSECQGK